MSDLTVYCCGFFDFVWFMSVTSNVFGLVYFIMVTTL